MTIEEITLDNNIILNYEFIHDNKSDKDVITNKVFDMINRQMLLCNKKISNPEVIMKESLFKNIKYNNVSITDTIYTDTLVTQDNMKMKKDIFLVFDNNQLTLSNIEIMKLIFENKYISVSEIKTHLSMRLEKYKIPDVIYFDVALPVGRTGKADRAQFKSQILSGVLNAAPQ
jgi:hypothetical protein